jgi:hypothetical protein
LLSFLKNYNYSNLVKFVIFNEKYLHSFCDDKNNTIILGIKNDWRFNEIVEMFLHESFHIYSHIFCRTNNKLCKTFLTYIKQHYKYRGFEFDKFHTKDKDILDDFSDHLIVLFNVIYFMTNRLKINKKYFLSEYEFYPKFIKYLLKNYKRVKKDLYK